MKIVGYPLKNYVIAQFVEAYTQHCLQHMQLGVNCSVCLSMCIFTRETVPADIYRGGLSTDGKNPVSVSLCCGPHTCLYYGLKASLW